jgi:hypothetical protein
MQKIIRIILVVIILTTVTSCLSVQDGGGKRDSSQPTLGQELIDLKKAKDMGAISQLEYKELKEILKNYYE